MPPDAGELKKVVWCNHNDAYNDPDFPQWNSPETIVCSTGGIYQYKKDIVEVDPASSCISQPPFFCRPSKHASCRRPRRRHAWHACPGSGPQHPRRMPDTDLKHRRPAWLLKW